MTDYLSHMISTEDVNHEWPLDTMSEIFAAVQGIGPTILELRVQFLPS